MAIHAEKKEETHASLPDLCSDQECSDIRERVRETSVQKFRAELVHADAVNHVIKQLIAISVECTDQGFYLISNVMCRRGAS